MITLCIPVLKKYDTLKQLILSAELGSLVPDEYLIIDNGLKFDFDIYPESIQEKIHVKSFGENIGVAKSWNYFITNTDDERLITNDDVIFYENSIKGLFDSPGDFVYSSANGKWSMFSMFLIRNSCIEKIGYFDESISPNYGYFEDNDYYRRMELQGSVKFFDCKIPWTHIGSATMKSLTNAELDDHHRKFKVARDNYQRKWGGLPGKETFRTEYNK